MIFLTCPQCLISPSARIFDASFPWHCSSSMTMPDPSVENTIIATLWIHLTTSLLAASCPCWQARPQGSTTSSSHELVVWPEGLGLPRSCLSLDTALRDNIVTLYIAFVQYTLCLLEDFHLMSFLQYPILIEISQCANIIFCLHTISTSFILTRLFFLGLLIKYGPNQGHADTLYEHCELAIYLRFLS